MLDQRPLIEAVLAAVNLPRPLAAPEPLYALLDPYSMDGTIARLRESGAAAGAILGRDLQRLERQLDRIAGAQRLDRLRRRTQAPLNRALRRFGVEFAAVPQFIGGRVSAPLRVRGFGAQAIYAAAALLLLDPLARIDKSRTYGQALRRCGYPDCRRFFLSYTGKAGGRPPDYHAPECKALHNKIMRIVREGK